MSILITQHARNTVAALEALLRYQFNDKGVLIEALLAPGCSIRNLGSRTAPDGNKRMAVLGDTVLKLIVIRAGYDNQDARGTIDNNVQRIGNNRNLERMGFTLGLDKHIYLNPSQRGVVSPRVMQDTVEALIGAVFLDGGLEAAIEVLAALGLE